MITLKGKGNGWGGTNMCNMQTCNITNYNFIKTVVGCTRGKMIDIRCNMI